MNRYLLFLLLVLLSGSAPLNAQDFTEGRILYDITFPELDMDEATRGSLPRESVVYVKGDLTRTDLNVGPRMSSTSIYNYKSGEVTALTEFMDSKTYIVMTPGKGPVPAQNNNQLTVFASDRKTIAGFECKRAVMKNKDNVSSNLYYTDRIKARLAVNVQFPGVDGFPMEFMVDQNGLKMMFSVRQVIQEPVSDSVFSIPSDYRLVTPNDLMQIYKSVEDSSGGGEIKQFELPKQPK